jgi:hypothetical protein
MFGSVALYSLALIPSFKKPLGETPKAAMHWLLLGAGLLSVQAAGIAWSIVGGGSAARTNVLYNSRAIWSVVLVWFAGGFFGNTENRAGKEVILRRLAGACCLVVAIVLAVGK